MKQVFIYLILIAAFIVGVGLLTKNLQNKNLSEIRVGSVTVEVDIADSEAERQKGLGGRASLKDNEGMLFVFNTEGGYSAKDAFPSFWMKGMLIPIDIIWINDGKVAKIHKNVPIVPAGTNDRNLLLYRPDKPIDYVLEVNAGFSEKNGLKEGDAIDLAGL